MENKEVRDYTQEELEFTKECLDKFLNDKSLASFQIHTNFGNLIVNRSPEHKANFKIGFGVDAVGEDDEEDNEDEIEEDEEE